MLAMGAQERVGFPDFLDEFAPLLGGDPAGLDQKRDDPRPEEFLRRDEAQHPSQRLRERRDGSLEIRLETSGHKELVRWVLSWVPDVEVLAPRSLRGRVREKLQ